MIQRIQSVFLLVAFIACIVMFFFSIASFYSDFYCFKLYVIKLKNMVPDSEIIFSSFFTIPLIIVVLLIAVLAMITIFLYKNRQLQIKINKLNILINIILIVGIFFGYPEIIERKIETGPSFEIGAYFPLISLVFLVLANRSIIKDEKLIKSADRLR
ncbi:MAG: DUF4293 domain-containing protein [Bacteroidales bacterium]|nr:DUF4293 domain-containing protein [Bacteroidales bacterium]